MLYGQLELLTPIRQDGDMPRKLYAVPNKQTKPIFFWDKSILFLFPFPPACTPNPGAETE